MKREALPRSSERHPRQRPADYRHNIRKALQAGATLRRARGADAWQEHVRLWKASMERCRKRDELIVGYVERDRPLLHRLIEQGMGEFFQAVVGGEALSSDLVLRAAEGAYGHSQGTSLAGMKCGASHFLISSIIGVLREESVRVFNLGESEFNSGLSHFKSRFGATAVPYEEATFYLGSDLRRRLTGAVRSLRRIRSVLRPDSGAGE